MVLWICQITLGKLGLGLDCWATLLTSELLSCIAHRSLCRPITYLIVNGCMFSKMIVCLDRPIIVFSVIDAGRGTLDIGPPNLKCILCEHGWRGYLLLKLWKVKLAAAKSETVGRYLPRVHTSMEKTGSDYPRDIMGGGVGGRCPPTFRVGRKNGYEVPGISPSRGRKYFLPTSSSPPPLTSHTPIALVTLRTKSDQI